MKKEAKKKVIKGSCNTEPHSKVKGKTCLTHAVNKTPKGARAGRGTMGEAGVRVIEYVRKRKTATLKQIAAALFSGDYLKAKNAVREPRFTGEIKFGSKRGSYVSG